MNRTNQIEQAIRINTAVNLLQKKAPLSAAVKALGRRYGISHRQAYRYILLAQQHGNRIAVPEPKKVFTVKLPIGLIQRIRQKARQNKKSISDIVMEALNRFLSKR